MYTVEDIKQRLQDKGVSPSNYRIKILKYLLENKNHATVDKIYTDLKADMPTMSKTTVYNTLEIFIHNNIVQVITIEEGETRYDADTSTHGHFKCTVCGEVYDFDVTLPNIDTESLKDFEIEEKHIYYKGRCNKCK